jgi:hypothetical protein
VLRLLQRFEEIWLGGRDSNPDNVLQRHASYRWTTSQSLAFRGGLATPKRSQQQSGGGGETAIISGITIR